MIRLDPSDIAAHDRMQKRLDQHFRNRSAASRLDEDDKTVAESSSSFLVEGIAVLFDEPILTKTGDIIVFEKGAFDNHITSGARGEIWFSHTSNDVVDSSDDAMELVTTDEYLAFRFEPKKKYANTVREKITSGKQSAISVGITRKKERTERWGKHDVIFIEQAECAEVSLVAEGACPQAFARIVDSQSSPPLRDSVKTVEFKLDRLAHNAKILARSLKTINNHIEDRVTLLEHRQQQRGQHSKVARSYSLDELNRLAAEETELRQSAGRAANRFYL